MSHSNQKPDLEDSINVTEAHGRVVREAAACARENRIVDNGIAPVSLWAFVACGIVLIVAGGILGSAGDLFAYGSTFREGYVRKPAGGAEDTGPVPKEALAAYMAKGAKIYSAKCNGCHGADAKGNGSTFPSLVGTWPIHETERFSMIILNGLEGPVDDGKTYGVMPPQGIGMTAEDLAGVMTYVRNNFGNSTGDVVTLDMAKSALEISAARKNAGKSVTGAELEADHLKKLPGDVLDPKTMLDPITLAPAKAP
ncbi:MAG: cytochrome c [Luteolibacter sp.]|uniref:c-type cytochrome n=1 Tax=Luteolibacter sp. TaxID=1962973 RepID=UPI0032642915